jgi:hypothetical protein
MSDQDRREANVLPSRNPRYKRINAPDNGTEFSNNSRYLPSENFYKSRKGEASPAMRTSGGALTSDGLKAKRRLERLDAQRRRDSDD